MANGEWSQIFDILVLGLSSGYPDACAYQAAVTMYVEHATIQHRALIDANTDPTSCSAWAGGLKTIFVLQAWVLRYNLMTTGSCSLFGFEVANIYNKVCHVLKPKKAQRPNMAANAPQLRTPYMRQCWQVSMHMRQYCIKTADAVDATILVVLNRLACHNVLL